MDARHPVAWVDCPDYGAALEPALAAALAQLGGWQAWVRPGQRVLVKPNMLADAAPERAVTTHPEFVRQVIRALKHAGAHVLVGDSPASAVSLAQVWQVTGIAAVCAEEQVPLLSFEQGGTRTVTRDGFSFAIATAALDADLIVNLPKVKSHGLTTLTAATKNFYGVLPGYQKTRFHRDYPRPARFGALLRALHAALPRSLSIADGVIGMEGEGPNDGDPVALGFLAASGDAVALDCALCTVLGLDPRRVPFLDPETASGQPLPFAWCGPTPAARRFRPPRSNLRARLMRLVPAPLLKMIMPLVWVRPAFDARCIACGRCVAACPVQALRLAPGARPVLDTARCIACCCCHEVCPAHAIHMTRSPLLRLLGVFRDLK